MANRLPIVGAFVLGGLLLFAVGLFFIGDRRMLFTDTIPVHIEWSRLAGLQNGAIVRVAGMDAGEVQAVELPTSPSGKFRIRVRIREDLHPLVRYDSVASIQNDGLVGNKFVQIQAGTDGSPQLPAGGTITGVEPIDLAEMLEKLNDTIDMVTGMISDVKVSLDEALLAVSSTATDAQALIRDTGAQVRAITASTQNVAEDLEAIMASVRQGRGSIGKLINEDELYDRVRAIASDAERAMADVRAAATAAKEAVQDFRGEDGPVRGVMGDLQLTIASARETLADLSDNAEALKRNFLFRGFFNRRGFFDLADIGIEEYRQGALLRNDRRVLRIWAGAEVLFETGANGEERLTDDGRARIDSAMATFLDYPRTTPLVVEGYASGATSDVRFLLSRQRATLVRDYIVGKFGLNTRYVGVMALGNEAPGSPSNGQWSGIALALFVDAGGR